MDIKALVRESIWNLQGYSSARHEYDGVADIFLDANENPYQSEINRYPDPFQLKLKDRLSEIKHIVPDRIFIGNGSDEAIDLIIRIFCEPDKDNIIIFPPTYGMYKVSADINNVKTIKSSLTADYQINTSDALSKINAHTKVAFICSPNNPTGNIMKRSDVLHFIKNFNGITVIDEAYIDFSDGPGYSDWIDQNPGLIILQTLSKAWGAAGIRLGIAMSNEVVIGLLNKVKPPYNVNSLSQQRALEVLSDEADFNARVNQIKRERERVAESLLSMELVRKVHPSEANFLLVEMDRAAQLFRYLREKGVVIRDRTRTHLCNDCLRITIGLPQENDRLLEEIGIFDNQESANKP
ncbi:MAG: histidinol-phosphate transaminase [Bacteroidia bacterium]|nr:histidinol-phosphate transaminase [Bacteroidia bacterium]